MSTRLGKMGRCARQTQWKPVGRRATFPGRLGGSGRPTRDISAFVRNVFARGQITLGTAPRGIFPDLRARPAEFRIARALRVSVRAPQILTRLGNRAAPRPYCADPWGLHRAPITFCWRAPRKWAPTRRQFRACPQHVRTQHNPPGAAPPNESFPLSQPAPRNEAPSAPRESRQLARNYLWLDLGN